MHHLSLELRETNSTAIPNSMTSSLSFMCEVVCIILKRKTLPTIIPFAMCIELHSISGKSISLRTIDPKKDATQFDFLFKSTHTHTYFFWEHFEFSCSIFKSIFKEKFNLKKMQLNLDFYSNVQERTQFISENSLNEVASLSNSFLLEKFNWKKMHLNLAFYSNVHTHTHTQILDWEQCELSCIIFKFISIRKIEPKTDATQFGPLCSKTQTHFIFENSLD